MPLPLQQRSIVPCTKCRYSYPRARMVEVASYPGGSLSYRCDDERACAGRVAERERLDAWKRRR